MTVAARYFDLLEHGRAVVGAWADDPPSAALQTKSHNAIGDLGRLGAAIDGRAEAPLLRLAAKEYQFALYAIATGSYRHAFTGFRLTFELALATVYFSAYEIKFRNWERDVGDIVWASIVDDDNGVYATNFIRAFQPDAAAHGKQYAALAKSVYRECSQYVHGNAKTHTRSDLELGFRKDLFGIWHEHADTVMLCTKFAYFARYLPHLPTVQKDGLEHLALESLGHLNFVQDAFSRA